MNKQILIWATLLLAMFANADDIKTKSSPSPEPNQDSQSIFFQAIAPEKDGEKLPNKTTEAARYWPQPFKDFLDAGVQIFQNGKPAPEISEIESLLKIQIQAKNEIPGQQLLVKNFRVDGWPFGATDLSLSHGQFSIISRQSDPFTEYALSLPIDNEKYCINPYDVAIYLGTEFAEGDLRLHASSSDTHPPSYSWGMFKRGSQGIHMSTSIWITTPKQRSREHQDFPCITSVRLAGKFIKEAK